MFIVHFGGPELLAHLQMRLTAQAVKEYSSILHTKHQHQSDAHNSIILTQETLELRGASDLGGARVTAPDPSLSKIFNSTPTQHTSLQA